MLTSSLSDTNNFWYFILPASSPGLYPQLTQNNQQSHQSPKTLIVSPCCGPMARRESSCLRFFTLSFLSSSFQLIVYWRLLYINHCSGFLPRIANSIASLEIKHLSQWNPASFMAPPSTQASTWFLGVLLILLSTSFLHPINCSSESLTWLLLFATLSLYLSWTPRPLQTWSPCNQAVILKHELVDINASLWTLCDSLVCIWN
jgi:hypothetical protein